MKEIVYTALEPWRTCLQSCIWGSEMSNLASAAFSMWYNGNFARQNASEGGKAAPWIKKTFKTSKRI